MRALVQRVARASVEVEGEPVGAIGTGLLVLLGVAPTDGEPQAAWLARKLAHLRIFRDAEGRMNRSALEVGGHALVVSQFTLYGDCRRGHRPSFIGAAPPEQAEPLYDRFCALLAAEGIPVKRGVFGAMMDVFLLNDGPVTILVDTP
ncbi:MAG: D-aminoacyl-tRNA deacylase [Pseudomonadota bacterium]